MDLDIQIQIRIRIATLVRRALADVCSVPVLLVSLVMTNYPLMGVVRVTWPVFLNFGSAIICLEWMKLGHFKFDVLTDIDEYRPTSARMIDYPKGGVFGVTRPL